MMRIFARGADRGSAVVEFALVAPLLVYLCFGVVDVGRYTYFGILAAHAARAALQYGAQTVITAADTTGITNAAVQDGQNLSAWHVTPGVSCAENGTSIACPANNAGLPPALVYYVTVQVTGTFQPLFTYPGIPSSVPVTATASMRIANQ